MKTYPYTTPDGIIELVRKDEHDKALELLREIRDDQVNAQDEADKFLRDHQPSELSKLRAELTRWQSLAESLANAIKEGGLPTGENCKLNATFHLRVMRDALAAYESAAKGEQP